MGDVSVPFDWKPGDAVVSIDNRSSRYIGIVVEILKYDSYGPCAMVYWPRGIDFVNVSSLRPAFF